MYLWGKCFPSLGYGFMLPLALSKPRQGKHRPAQRNNAYLTMFPNCTYYTTPRCPPAGSNTPSHRTSLAVGASAVLAACRNVPVNRTRPFTPTPKKRRQRDIDFIFILILVSTLILVLILIIILVLILITCARSGCLPRLSYIGASMVSSYEDTFEYIRIVV